MAELDGLVLHPRHQPDVKVAVIRVDRHRVIVEYSAANLIHLLAVTEITAQGLKALHDGFQWLESLKLPEVDAVATDARWVITNVPQTPDAVRINKIACEYQTRFHTVLDHACCFKPEPDVVYHWVREIGVRDTPMLCVDVYHDHINVEVVDSVLQDFCSRHRLVAGISVIAELGKNLERDFNIHRRTNGNPDSVREHCKWLQNLVQREIMLRNQSHSLEIVEV